MQEVNVVVVGGGAAGLAAAAELRRLNVSALVIEAQPRLGGRILTVERDGDAPFERGAQMINGDMSAVLELAAEEQLHVSPMPATGRDLCYLDGEVLPRSELISADEAEALLADAIRSWSSPGDIWKSTWSLYRWWTEPWESFGEAKRGAELAISSSTPPKDSLGGAIRRLLLCSEDEAIVRTAMAEQFGADPDLVNARAAKTTSTAYQSDRCDAEFHLVAGMTRIIQALAGQLSQSPLLNRPVTGITVEPDGVRVATPSADYRAQRVIVAVPPTVARRIDFKIARRKELHELLSSFSDGAVIKTTLVYDRAFWRENGCSGTVSFAAPLGLEVRDTSYDGAAKPRLTAFLGGPEARARASLPEKTRRDLLLTDLSAVLGGQVHHFRAIDEGIWVDHPWSGGGYNAYLRCGQPSDAAARLADWPGPVCFAGAELDTDFSGYVEGAIRSGRRVAARVAEELKANVGAICGT